MRRIVSVSIFFTSLFIISFTSVFIIPNAFPSAFLNPLVLPFIAVVLLFFTRTPRFSFLYTVALGMLIDIFSAPHISLALGVLCGIWGVLFLAVSASKTLPHSIQQGTSIACGSLVLYVSIIGYAAYRGEPVGQFVSLRDFVIASGALTLGCGVLLWILRRFVYRAKEYLWINSQYAPKSHS